MLDSRTYKKGEAEPLTDRVPVKAEDDTNRYIFAGWDTGRVEGTTKTYTPQFASVTKEKPKAAAHIVTFYTSGGSAISPQKVEDGKTAVRPADPVKEGFTFDGWYTDATYAAVFDFSQPIKANTVLFAKWKTNTPATPVPVVSYAPTESGELIFAKGSNSSVTFTIKRAVDDASTFSHFTGIRIDGGTLTNGKDYTARPGSVVITLNASALERLEAGNHTVRVLFDDGSVDKVLTVNRSGNAKNADPANTGDTFKPGIWIFLLAAAAAGIVLALWAIKKRKKDEEEI